MNIQKNENELELIVNRIDRDDIDLQPHFQRGEVWSPNKKKMLIDSILRGWQIPPIHVIQESTGSKQEVLDGQQRLATIRDFLHDKIRIDGFLEPQNKEIQCIHNHFFSELSLGWQRKVLQYELTVIRVMNFDPNEPRELFFRLNQPATLTAAEQRNAFFGEARSDIKNTIKKISTIGFDEDFIGFSNSRLILDDVFSRLFYHAENGGINIKVSSQDLAERYRRGFSFPKPISDGIQEACFCIYGSSQIARNQLRVKFNRATLFSWIWFVYSREIRIATSKLWECIHQFESLRLDVKKNVKTMEMDENIRLFSIYNDRSSTRIFDASSSMLRDYCISRFCFHEQNSFNSNIAQCIPLEYDQLMIDHKQDEKCILDQCNFNGWGSI